MPDYHPEKDAPKDAPKVRRAWEETVDPEDESVGEVAGASYRMVGGSPSLPPRTNRVEPATVSEVNLEDLSEEEFVNFHSAGLDPEAFNLVGLKETDIDNDAPVLQLGSQGGAGSSPPDEREGLSAGSDNDSLFSSLRATRLQEAQEFRRKGYNSQVPEVDSRLVTQLREAVAMAKSRISLHATVGGPLGSLWLLDQIVKIERLTGKLSDDVIKSWVKDELPGRSSGEAEEVELGSRRTAQSLARRLESTLQTLIRVVHTLCAIDDHSTPKKRGELLVTELASAFSSSDESSVIQALKRMTSEVSGDTAWTSLMQARAAGWETDKAAAISTMIETTRHEAEKANEKARALPGYSASQAFFSGVATYLQSLSGELKKASGNASQSTSSPIMPYVNNDKAVAPLSRSGSLPQRFMAGVGKKKSQAQIALAGGEGKLHQLGRIIRHGDLTKTPSKNTERVVADSAIRSILWQWQQTAIKIQYASGAILSKVKELKKIEEMFSSDAVTYDKGGQQEGQDTSVSHPGEDDLVAQVRQWVNDSIEQTKPENQQAEKLAVLNKLLDGDIDNARALIGRLREKAESMQSLLKQQRYAVLKMIIQRSGLDPSLRAVDELLPDVAKDLTASLAALENACQAAAIRHFAEAEKQADYAQLRATKVKEGLSAKSARLTERPLDEHSRGSRLAKHWANLAKEQNQHNDQPPDAERVFSSLKKQGLLEGVLSTGDPEGYLFATRLAGELENARNDELRLPMSPEQYTALEKGLVEYIVKWGQKRVSRGIARIIIELSFEQGLDAVSFSVSSLFRIPFKVLKASIKVPYNVNKVNNYTMPGHDKPYKAIYGLLEKKLKQLGFNILTAPVPGMIKLGAGAVVTAGAALYNVHVGNRENTFSAVYGRLTEGGESGKIKMQSAGEMLFDTVIDTSTAAAFKGTRIAWGAGKSENSAIPDNALVNEHVRAVLAQQDQMKAEEDSPVSGNAAENEREAKPESDAMPLRQQAEVKPFSDENDQASRQPRIRSKRSLPPAPSNNVREDVPAPSRQWHQNIPADASLQSEHFDFDRGIRYQDFSDEKKQHTYAYGITFVLHQIENDDSLPKEIRYNAYLARHGAKILVPVDIGGYKLNNTILLPGSYGSKTGVLIWLDSETPYYYVGQGSDLPEDLVLAMPYDANIRPKRGAFQDYVASRLSGVQLFDAVRRGGVDVFGKRFNYNNPGEMDVASLSTRLADTINNDYKLAGRTIGNRLLISRAIAGAHIPDDGISVKEVPFHVSYTWGGSTAAEYLRGFERPFSTLSGDMQRIISSNKGETVREANMHIAQAEYIGSWIDATAGAITSLTPAGWVLNTLQSATGIIADLTEGKKPDALMVAGLVIGCIPEGRIVARIAKLSRIGGKAVKYGLMLGNKSVDLAIVGRSIKTAMETGDPLAIYQALLASGMSAKSSYDMAKNMSSTLKISRRMEDSASWEELEAIHNNTPESILPSTMTERRFKVGSSELLGRINNGEIEISSDGVTWDKGSALHLLAYRLQNAGGKSKLKAGGYEPHTPGYQHDYSIDLSGLNGLRAKVKLKLGKGDTRVQRFNEETGSYYNSDDYEVLPYQTTITDVDTMVDGGDTVVDDSVVRSSLEDMHRKFESLKRIAADYTGSGAADLRENLQMGGTLVSELRRGLPDSQSGSTLHFLLIEKTPGPVTADKILGFAKIVDLLPGDTSGEKGAVILESVVAHPYTLISKNKDFIEYAVSRGLQLSQEERTRYNIKRVGGQLMRDGLKKTMQKIDREVKMGVKLGGRSSRPDSIQFSSRNPITARLAESFGVSRVGDSGTPEKINFVHTQQPKAARETITRDSPGLIAETLNLELTELEPLTSAQQQTCDQAKKLLEKDSTILKYIAGPTENCANAAKKVTELLTGNGYTNIRFAELGMWKSDYGGPTNHFVVFASHNDVDIAIDITAGQFRRGEMSGPIYTTVSNWKLIVKSAFGGQSNLVKYKEFSVPFKMNTHATTSDIFDGMKNPFVRIEGGEILTRPKWHTKVFDTLNLRERAYRDFDDVIGRTLSVSNGASSAKSPWEFVLALQSDAGLLTTSEDLKLLDNSWRQANSKRFLGPNERAVNDLEQLSKLPKGSRLQLTVLDTGEVHPMLSLGGGYVISVDNTWMGLGYGAGIQKINLLHDLQNGKELNSFHRKGVLGDITIRAEEGSRLPTVESISAMLPAQQPAAREIIARDSPGLMAETLMEGRNEYLDLTYRNPGKLIAARRGYKDYSLSTTSAVREYTTATPAERQAIMQKAHRNELAFNRIFGAETAEVLPTSAAAGEDMISLRLKKLPGESLADIIEGADQTKIDEVLSSDRENTINDLVNTLAVEGITHKDINLHNIVYDPKQRKFYFSDFDDVEFMGSNAEGTTSVPDTDINSMKADLKRVFDDFALSNAWRNPAESTSAWGPKLPVPHSSISQTRVAELKGLAVGTETFDESVKNQKAMSRNEGKYYSDLFSYKGNRGVWSENLKKGSEKYTAFYEKPGVQAEKSKEYNERYMEESSQNTDAPYIDEAGQVTSSPGKVVVLKVKGDTQKRDPYRFRVSDDGTVLVVDDMFGHIDRSISVGNAGVALPMNELQGEFIKSRPDVLKHIKYVTQETIANAATQTVLKTISPTIQKGLKKELIVLTPNGASADAFRVMLNTPNVQPTARMLSTYPEIGKQIVEIRIYGLDRITMVLAETKTADERFGASRIGDSGTSEKINFVHTQPPKAAHETITRDSPGLMAETLKEGRNEYPDLTNRNPGKPIAARRGYKDYSLSTTSAVREYTTATPAERQAIMHKARRNELAFNRIYGAETAEVLPTSEAADENMLSLRLKKLPGKSLAEIIENADQTTINGVLESDHESAISDLVNTLAVAGIVHNDINLHNIVYDPIQRKFYFSDFDNVDFMGRNAQGAYQPLFDTDINSMKAGLRRVFDDFIVSNARHNPANRG